jgi:putative PIN family toxin of toxin-antitoxin system
MRNKLVVDTNIFISGWFEGDEDCEKILELIKNREVQLLFGQDTIGELLYTIKNFARHNIDDTEIRIRLLNFISELFYHSTSVNTMNTIIEKTNDEYDDMFLKCALQGDANYLVSDDFKAGMHEREYDELVIIGSNEFISIYEEKNGIIELNN